MAELTEAVSLESTLEYEEGDQVGVFVNEQLVVQRVQQGTVADGKLHPGDVLRSVNGRPIETCNHLFRLLGRAWPAARVALNRPVRAPLTLHRMQTIRLQCTPEYSYFVAIMVVRPNAPLGLGIKTVNNRVIVSRLDRNSLSAECYAVGDFIRDVDGVPVIDQETTKTRIIAAMTTNKRVTTVVERAESFRSKTLVRAALDASRRHDVDPPLAADAALIGRRESDRLRRSPPPVPKPILVRSGRNSKNPKLSFAPRPQETAIFSDTDAPRLLMRVPVNPRASTVATSFRPN